MVLGVIRIYFTKQLTGPARASMRLLAQAGLECIVYICVLCSNRFRVFSKHMCTVVTYYPYLLSGPTATNCQQV